MKDARPAMAALPITGDQRLVKSINRTALLRLLRDETGLSRADLADRSGLTRSTVSLITKELIDDGWVAEDDVLVTGALGRRPTPLRLDGSRLALIGAELTPDTIRVVSTSIRGDVQEVNQATLRHTDPEGACHQLVEMVTVLVRSELQRGHEVLGIGVGLPGAVDSTTGVLQYAPNIGWRQVPVGARLRAELQSAGLGHVPAYCQNEADLAAVGETEFSQHPADDPLVYISCGVGVGSGIVLGNTLFTGATGAGGEIGHTTLHIKGRQCSCGRLGCAEAYLGLRAIAAEAHCIKDGMVDRQALKVQAAGRNAATRTAFESAGRSLGVLLQNVWTTFDPKAIVLGGETVALGGQPFIDAALHVLEDYAQHAGVTPPPVRISRYTELATAVGGAAYALYCLMRPYAALQQHASND
jgi:predicted NBD/HSP70 family sugar kinase